MHIRPSQYVRDCVFNLIEIIYLWESKTRPNVRPLRHGRGQKTGAFYGISKTSKGNKGRTARSVLKYVGKDAPWEWNMSWTFYLHMEQYLESFSEGGIHLPKYIAKMFYNHFQVILLTSAQDDLTTCFTSSLG